MPTDSLSDPMPPTAAPSVPRRMRAAMVVTALLMLIPTATQTQVRSSCPRFARVPGYGACTNIGGNSCGFCAYRCNDETVVRWNVCSL